MKQKNQEELRKIRKGIIVDLNSMQGSMEDSGVNRFMWLRIVAQLIPMINKNFNDNSCIFCGIKQGEEHKKDCKATKNW